MDRASDFAWLGAAVAVLLVYWFVGVVARVDRSDLVRRQRPDVPVPPDYATSRRACGPATSRVEPVSRAALPRHAASRHALSCAPAAPRARCADCDARLDGPASRPFAGRHLRAVPGAGDRRARRPARRSRLSSAYTRCRASTGRPSSRAAPGCPSPRLHSRAWRRRPRSGGASCSGWRWGSASWRAATSMPYTRPTGSGCSRWRCSSIQYGADGWLTPAIAAPLAVAVLVAVATARPKRCRRSRGAPRRCGAGRSPTRSSIRSRFRAGLGRECSPRGAGEPHGRDDPRGDARAARMPRQNGASGRAPGRHAGVASCFVSAAGHPPSRSSTSCRDSRRSGCPIASSSWSRSSPARGALGGRLAGAPGPAGRVSPRSAFAVAWNLFGPGASSRPCRGRFPPSCSAGRPR